MAALYTAVPILNWGGYTAQQAVFVGAITLPTVLFDLAVFWALAVRALDRPVSPLAPGGPKRPQA